MQTQLTDWQGKDRRRMELQNAAVAAALAQQHDQFALERDRQQQAAALDVERARDEAAARIQSSVDQCKVRVLGGVHAGVPLTSPWASQETHEAHQRRDAEVRAMLLGDKERAEAECHRLREQLTQALTQVRCAHNRSRCSQPVSSAAGRDREGEGGRAPGGGTGPGGAAAARRRGRRAACAVPAEGGARRTGLAAEGAQESSAPAGFSFIAAIFCSLKMRAVPRIWTRKWRGTASLF